MASLNHKNFVRVIDFEEQKHIAIIMEYLEGKTLNTHIKQ